MSGRTPATQADVARIAGVSTASVSRVLNGSDLVKLAVRERVERAIATLNYIPNQGARALAMRRTRILGAIIPTLNNAIFAGGINAFERAARERGYTLMLSVSNYDLEEERRLVRKMIERGVDGVLLVGNDHLDESYDDLDGAGLRHACAWSYSATARAANVGFSNSAAMADLVDHLVGYGHRRIAMLSGITEFNDRARGRVAGVRKRLATHGLDLPPDLVIEVPYAIRAAREAFPGLAATGATAIVCGNDVIALGALLEAGKQGLDIPGELSITGFDNLALTAEIEPAITTVDVPADEMGTAAAGALIDAIEASMPVAGRRLRTRLLVRGTTGPAATRL